MRDPTAPIRGGATKLVGREHERAVLDELIAAVRGGESRALLVHGEPGVGKTALLDYLVAQASACCRVVSATGVEFEMELPFAGLHQLCAPLLERLEAIPPPQREALSTIFGISGGPAPDRFLVALAVLSLLSEAAAEVPLFCVVDDAHWLDHASAQVLAFAARRLGSESVAVVVGARIATAELVGLPEMVVEGLREEEARVLLESALRVPLDGRVRDQIVAETGGNPLGLLEVSRGITTGQMAGRFGFPLALNLPATLEERFRTRVEGLPPDTRSLLLLAATDPTGDGALVWRAAGVLGIDAIAAKPLAEDAELVSFGARVRFRHPLVRSAVYRSASPEERRAAHGALADAIDAEREPDQHAWHHAQAVVDLDEDVAGELERSAGRAQSRGGMAAAAAFLERSAQLTGDPVRRFERTLAAAHAVMQAGAFEKSRDMLTRAEACAPDERASARADLLRGQIAFAASAGREAPGLLLRAAVRLEAVDPALARQTYLDAWNAAWFAGRFAVAGNLREVSLAARSAPPAPGPPRPADLLLDALAVLVTEGRARAAPALREAAQTFAEGPITVDEWLRYGWIAVTAATVLWDEDPWYAILTRGLQQAREAGLLAHLPIYVARLSIYATRRGDFAAAGPLAAESDAIVATTGTAIGSYAAVYLAAHQGHEAEARRLMDHMTRATTAAGQGLGVQFCQMASAMLYNSLGRYDEALSTAQLAADETPELHISSWAFVELVEAAVRVGDTPRAADALERLVESTGAAGTEWALGLEARSRALVADGAAAEALYVQAIEHLGRTRLRPDLARAHLLFGEWLRRENRRTDARVHLRRAYELLSTIGMDAFAERARRELAATGETVRKRTVETAQQLTPQELQIAQLAVEGRTNVEIGTQLFLSRRTVEWHMGKVFSKLEISSRRELRDRLARQPVLTSAT